MFERGDHGRLTRISAGNRCYVDASIADETCFDEGFVRMRSVETPQALVRSVTANGAHWTETYRWNASRQMVEIDDVQIVHDEDNRVVSCRGAAGVWFYGYSGAHLTVIDGPGGLRQIVRDAAGRPRHLRESQQRAVA